MARRVLVCGGLAGSVLLADLGPGYPLLEVWASISRLVLEDRARWLRLDPDGINPYTGYWCPRLVAGPPIPGFFSQMMGYLRGQGFSPIGVNCDWRLSIERNGASLADQILRYWTTEPVSLVCHSYGGLVGASALATLKAQGQIAAVDKFVTLGTPWGGSYWPIAYWMAWEKALWALGVLQAFQTVARGLFLQTYSPRAMIGSWPSFYQTLPRINGPSGQQDPAVRLLYQADVYTSRGGVIEPAHLAHANTTQDVGRTVPSEVAFWAYVGTSRETPIRVRDIERLDHKDGLVWANEGDEAVRDVDAQLPGRNVRTFPFCEHKQLVTAPDVLKALAADLAAPIRGG